jgi:hypothetical protein
LPAPHDVEALQLLKQYVQIRLDLTERTQSVTKLNSLIARSNDLQDKLWQQATEITAKNTGVLTALFGGALNEMFSNQAKRLAAFRARVPSIVFMALYVVAVIASAFAGYSSGLEIRRTRLPAYIMGALVAAVILLIQDLDRPDVGFVQTSQQPMIDVANRISGRLN